MVKREQGITVDEVDERQARADALVLPVFGTDGELEIGAEQCRVVAPRVDGTTIVGLCITAAIAATAAVAVLSSVL